MAAPRTTVADRSPRTRSRWTFSRWARVGGARNRSLVVACLAAIAVAAPASAADQFQDVNANSTHASTIREVTAAGVTAGCRTGRYCPSEPVTRDQMASFLTRTGSRASFETNVTDLSAANGYDGVPASVTARSAAAAGGTSMVTLTGSISVYADTSGGGGDVTSCPCEIEAFIFRDGGQGPAQGPSSWAQLPGTVAGNGRSSTSLPVTWVAEIPSGTSQTFRIAVFLNDEATPTGVRAEAALSAVVSPFSG
jgi:hypothetical protein